VLLFKCLKLHSSVCADETDSCVACQKVLWESAIENHWDKEKPRLTVCICWNCSYIIVHTKAVTTHVHLRTAWVFTCWSMHSPTHSPAKSAEKLSSVRRMLFFVLHISVNSNFNIHYCIHDIFAAVAVTPVRT